MKSTSAEEDSSGDFNEAVDTDVNSQENSMHEEKGMDGTSESD